MIKKGFILILLFSFTINAKSQPSLIGKWRRVHPYFGKQDTLNKVLSCGDLDIRTDSTFHIEGDTATADSTISGWHVGDAFDGTWELPDPKRLIFRLAPKEHKMFLWYKIIKLTKEKLILRSGFYQNDKKHDITYLRL